LDAAACASRETRERKVHSLEGSLAILEGVGGDVKPGTLLDIGTNGVTGVLVSHREPKTFALMYHYKNGDKGSPVLGAGAAVAAGDLVTVRKRSRFYMPPESDVLGRRLGPLGEPLDGGAVPGGDDRDVAAPVGAGSELFREPPSVEDRKPINTPLVTGVAPLDVLTPVGRGQCMLLTGEVGTKLSELGLNAIVAQTLLADGDGDGDERLENEKRRKVRCVYGAVGASAFDSGESAFQKLRDAGATDFTVVSCSPDASLAERYAATCAAFAVAEGARGEGKDVLLVLDDFTGLIGFSKDMARLSPQLVIGEDDAGATKERMVEYEGMIINALLAERRRFLGMTLQRVARMNDKKGGGSLTLLGVMYHEKGAYRGLKASEKNSGMVGETAEDGAVIAVPSLPANFESMQPEMRAKIEKAIEAKKRLAEEQTAKRNARLVSPGASANDSDSDSDSDSFENHEIVQPRPLVEEFMSITDGQVFVESFSKEIGWGISVKDSVSRIGLPGAAGPFTSLNVLQLRLDVMQADDMSVFGGNGEEKVTMRDRSAAIRGVLRQRPGSAAKLSAQTIGLYALQRGKLVNMNSDEAQAFVSAKIQLAETKIPGVLRDIDANPSKRLTAEVEAEIETLFE
jgi:F-type H+-transporting ATPase subunit alpha